MSRALAFHFVLTRADLPQLPVWQNAIDQMNLLFRPTLLAANPASRIGQARIGERTIPFEIERRPIDAVMRPADLSHSGHWSFATGFRADGTQESWAMSIIAASSLARSSDGVRYNQTAGIIREGPDLIHILDVALAAAMGEMDKYYTRYFNERPPPTALSQPATIEARLFRGSPRMER